MRGRGGGGPRGGHHGNRGSSRDNNNTHRHVTPSSSGPAIYNIDGNTSFDPDNQYA